MGFVYGLIFGALVCACLMLEICQAVRTFYSVILLGGIIALGAALLLKGIMLTPLFVLGVLVNIPIIFVSGMAGGSKDGKQ